MLGAGAPSGISGADARAAVDGGGDDVVEVAEIHRLGEVADRPAHRARAIADVAEAARLLDSFQFKML